MASVGLLRRNPDPTDDEIREALGSNICRCTGYVKIIEAVKYAAALQRRGSRAMNEIVPDPHNIGDYVPLVDGPEKVSGRAKYTADILAPGMLAGPHLSAAPIRMPRFSTSMSPRRCKLPGVKAIVTGADCDKTFGVLPIARSEHPLARDRVRYRGEPVAAVAADRRCHRRRRRSRCIKLKVRELPAYYTAQAAMAPGAVQLHEQQARQSRARRALRARQCRAGLRRCRPGARGHLQLRRGLPEPDGDARRGRRLRRRARPHDGACLDPGALLRAPDAVARSSTWTCRASA